MLVRSDYRPSFFGPRPGAAPVREWLKGLSRKDRLTIGEDIKDIEFSWSMGMPLCRSLGEGLWEVRTRLDDRVVRVFFCVSGELMVLLHGFIKKSRGPRRAIWISPGDASANWRNHEG